VHASSAAFRDGRHLTCGSSEHENAADGLARVGDREHRDTLGADGVERLDLGAVVRSRIGGRDQPIGPLLVAAPGRCSR